MLEEYMKEMSCFARGATDKSKEHHLKILPEYFERVRSGEKLFELRKDDRGFCIGDTLFLEEWLSDSRTYTGRVIMKEVTYILRDAEKFGLAPGFCILGMK